MPYSKGGRMNLTVWEKHPSLKQNWVRLVSPNGDVKDLWKGYLESVLEGSDEPLQVFRSQKAWDEFLATHRLINAQWALRTVVTGEDTKWLQELGVCWNAPDPKMRELIETTIWHNHMWTIWFSDLIAKHGTEEEKATLKQMRKESSEETTRRFEEERLKLAKRISKHQAPGQP